MKWNLITHKIWGLNDSESNNRERGFLNSLSLRINIIMLQKPKLRGQKLDNLGARLMPGCANWILEADPGKEVGSTHYKKSRSESTQIQQFSVGFNRFGKTTSK